MPLYAGWDMLWEVLWVCDKLFLKYRHETLIEHTIIIFFLGAQRAARTGSEDAIVPRVNVEADSALVLQLAVNVIQMSVEIAGLGNWLWSFLVFLLDTCTDDSTAWTEGIL